MKPILLFHSLAIEFNKVEKYALLMIFFPSQWRVYLMVICNLCKTWQLRKWCDQLFFNFGGSGWWWKTTHIGLQDVHQRLIAQESKDLLLPLNVQSSCLGHSTWKSSVQNERPVDFFSSHLGTYYLYRKKKYCHRQD